MHKYTEKVNFIAEIFAHFKKTVILSHFFDKCVT
jgi:hypothetical protein